MRRSTALRLSIAALVLAPTMTACNVPNVSLTTDSSTTAAPQPTVTITTTETATADPKPAPTTDPAPEPTTDPVPEPTTDPAPEPTTSPAPTTDPAPAPTTAPAGTDDDSASQGRGGSQKVGVPSGVGISALDVFDVYGVNDGETDYAHITGLGSMTNNDPVMLNLRVRLFDAQGKQIAENTGLNAVYSVGKHDLVTSNLVKVPAGPAAKSFKVNLIDATRISRGPRITKLGKPRVGAYSKVSGMQALHGTVTFTGAIGTNTVEADGACKMPDGTVYNGRDHLGDNPSRPGPDGTTTLNYEIALDNANKVDLSKATCYVSA